MISDSIYAAAASPAGMKDRKCIVLFALLPVSFDHAAYMIPFPGSFRQEDLIMSVMDKLINAMKFNDDPYDEENENE